MPIFLLIAVAVLARCSLIWWRNYKLPLRHLEARLIEGGWISPPDKLPRLVSNTFMYGDFPLYRSEKAQYDILFGRLTSRASTRHFVAFLFPTGGGLSYATNSPFVLQRRWLAASPGILDQFSPLTWYSDEKAANHLRRHLPLPIKGVEASFLIEGGIGMIMFTFQRLPAGLDIGRLAAVARELHSSL